MPTDDPNSPNSGKVKRPRPASSAFPDREHLPRLENVWIPNPIYFLTCCTDQRRLLLANEPTSAVLISEFRNSRRIHRWSIGRYVIMPDHVHFFARPEPNAKTLPDFIRDWKRWTAHQIVSITKATAPIWQPEYFDHVLRTPDSYSEKWVYVRQNPVRVGLALTPEGWPFAGECEPLTF